MQTDLESRNKKKCDGVFAVELWFTTYVTSNLSHQTFLFHSYPSFSKVKMFHHSARTFKIMFYCRCFYLTVVWKRKYNLSLGEDWKIPTRQKSASNLENFYCCLSSPCLAITCMVQALSSSISFGRKAVISFYGIGSLLIHLFLVIKEATVIILESSPVIIL